MLALLLCVGFIAGSLLPWQPVVNSRLGESLQSPVWSGFISFTGGALLLGLIALTQGNILERFQKLTTVPLWTLSGGVLGSFFVIVSILLVPRVGATTLSLCFICGQIIMSVMMDHYGLAGLTVRPLDTYRLIGILFLLAGLLLVVKTPHAS